LEVVPPPPPGKKRQGAAMMAILAAHKKKKAWSRFPLLSWITRSIINRFKGTAQQQIQVNAPSLSVFLAAATADFVVTRRS
jgi:hypothetical protein